MEKVKITQEQAEAIENLKDLYKNNLDEFMNYQLIEEKLKTEYEWEHNEIKEANNIPNRDFIKLLHYGYEVEEEFSKGDWIVYNNNPKIITEINRIGEDALVWGNFLHDGGHSCAYKHELRHATESEIAEEEKRRTNKKLDEILLDLSDDERDGLYKKLVRGDY